MLKKKKKNLRMKLTINKRKCYAEMHAGYQHINMSTKLIHDSQHALQLICLSELFDDCHHC